MNTIRQWWDARAQAAGRPRYQTTADVERDWAAHYEARASEAETEAARAAYAPPRRTPLTTNQHILHLLLTVFTAGLWAPVWIIRAVQGNRPG